MFLRSQHSVLLKLIRCMSTNVSLSTVTLKKTALYDFHVKHGAKMVEFAGWEMPVQYEKQSIIQSHLHTREQASLFDVSHMLQCQLAGRDSERFLESLTVADLKG